MHKQISRNGAGAPVVTERALTMAQQQQVKRLIAQLERAQMEFEAAQKVRDIIQANANNFILYCAEEQGIALGAGWALDQNSMSFVRMPAVGDQEEEDV